MEQDLIGKNPALSGIFLMAKRVLNLHTLKRNPNFQMPNFGLLLVGCLRKTN